MPHCYHIVVQGHLDVGWSTWFGGLHVTHGGHDRTLLAGVIRDQAELHGALVKIRDLGLPLISVQLVTPGVADDCVGRSDDACFEQSLDRIEQVPPKAAGP